MDSLDPIVLHCNVHWKLQFIVWTMILAEKDNDEWKVMCVGSEQTDFPQHWTCSCIVTAQVHEKCISRAGDWLTANHDNHLVNQPTELTDLKKWKYGRKVCKETHIVIVSNILSISVFLRNTLWQDTFSNLDDCQLSVAVMIINGYQMH